MFDRSWGERELGSSPSGESPRSRRLGPLVRAAVLGSGTVAIVSASPCRSSGSAVLRLAGCWLARVACSGMNGLPPVWCALRPPAETLPPLAKCLGTSTRGQQVSGTAPPGDGCSRLGSRARVDAAGSVRRAEPERGDEKEGPGRLGEVWCHDGWPRRGFAVSSRQAAGSCVLGRVFGLQTFSPARPVRAACCWARSGLMGACRLRQEVKSSPVEGREGKGKLDRKSVEEDKLTRSLLLKTRETSS